MTGLRIAALILLAACGPSGPRVVVYVSQDEMYSEPILRDFTARTGIAVLARQDSEADKAIGHVNRLLALDGRQEADVFWNNEIARTIALARRGLLARHDFPTAGEVPDSFRDAEGRWVGFGARARVILFNTELVDPAEAPSSIRDFLEPRWRGRFAVARPLFGTSATHAAALFAHLGPEQAQALLSGWVENGALVLAGNAQCRNAVRDGRIAACLTDTDDAHLALLSGAPVRMVYPDQEEGGLGTLVIPNTVMLIAGGPNPEEGRALADYIASREVEARLAQLDGAQMPVRAGVPPRDERFDLASIRAMPVDWEAVADQLEPCTRFVEEAFRE